MKYLYRRLKTESVNLGFDDTDDINVEVFIPKARGGFVLPGEKRNFKLLATRLIFQLITFGKAKIYYVKQNEELVHTSYVIPKCFKFPFLKKYDYEIGPCFTYPKYRGRGIYPRVIEFISCNIGTDKSGFYMIVDANNVSSVRGIEKAGFKKVGKIKISKVMKKYQIDKS